MKKRLLSIVITLVLTATAAAGIRTVHRETNRW